MKSTLLIGIVLALLPLAHAKMGMVDTGQVQCYSDRGESSCPGSGRSFSGQDAQYQGLQPSYKDNGNETVSDLVTGLMWSKVVDSNKVSLNEARQIAKSMNLGGYNDWRVPNIKELYSLIDFRGYTGFMGRGSGGFNSGVPSNAIPFINTDYFNFQYGDTGAGERYIDAQWLSSTEYVYYTMGRMKTLFGVNFADGRIKGYGYQPENSGFGREGNFGPPEKKFFVRYVRGPYYGQNDFIDNKDGTVTDQSTGFIWMQRDSGKGLNWENALAYCEGLYFAGKDDWRLPNAKELQYIVDYSRSPDTTSSAALDPIFQISTMINEAGQKDYPFFWTSTTHLDGPHKGDYAAYVTFGRGIGQMRGTVMDVHGAGAQRSDPKTGSAQIGHGPQGDAVRVKNHVRCVRGGDVKRALLQPESSQYRYPYNVSKYRKIGQSSSTGSRSNQSFGSMNQQGGNQPGMGNMQQGMQSGNGQRDGNRFVQRLDKNGDGKVSRDEFDGPPQAFDHHDQNRDGYLSQGEAPQGPPPGMQGQRGF